MILYNAHQNARRRFIKKATAFTAAACAYQPLRNFALAPPPSIKRVVFVFIPGGALPGYWQGKGCGNNFSLPQMSAPLEPIKQHLVFLNNLTMTRGGHGISFNALGGWYAPDRASIDIELIPALQGATPFGQITLNAGSPLDPNVTRATGNNSTASLFDPFKAYQVLFGDLPATQKSLLDENFNGDYASIRNNFEQLSQRHIELVVLALQRNKTNIATLMLGSDEADFYVPGTAANLTYHSIMSSGSFADYAKARAYLTKRFTYLVQLLAATKDSANRSLLDSTLVVMVSDMGDGSSHGLDGAPFLLAGANNYLHTNRLINATGYTHLDFLDTVSALLGTALPKYGKGPIAEILA